MSSEGYSPYLVAAAGAIPLIFLYRYLSQGPKYSKQNRIDGKVVIVTGANCGIGKEVALELARRGGKVYMACRNRAKGEVACLEIIEKSGNPNVFCRILDLASFESIRNFVKEFKKLEETLDILVNNAGVMATPHTKTVDRMELQLQTNLLGPFLLTNLLLEHLKASSPGRIVNVTSQSHQNGELYRENINLDRGYCKWKAYRQSKLAVLLFSLELAKRLKNTGVVVNTANPGCVNTQLTRHLNPIMTNLVPLKFFYKTPANGAQTILFLALDNDIGKYTGRYFVNCSLAVESVAARNTNAAHWLWQKSENLTGLRRR